MASRNSRTREYQNYAETSISGLKPIPTSYGLPGTSSITLVSNDGTTYTSASMSLVPQLTTATSIALTSPGGTQTSGVATIDAGRWFRLNHASDVVYNMQSGFPVNAIIMGVQAGVGKLIFASPAGGINPVEGYAAKTRGQGAVFALIHNGNNYWDIMGDLEAL